MTKIAIISFISISFRVQSILILGSSVSYVTKDLLGETNFTSSVGPSLLSSLRSSRSPFPLTETICVQRGDEKPERVFFFPGQISSNVSTERPLIWLIFQTFDEQEKDSRRVL